MIRNGLFSMVVAFVLAWLAPSVAAAGDCPVCETSDDCPGGLCVVWDESPGCGGVTQICCPGQGCNLGKGGRPSCEIEGRCCVVGDPGCSAAGETGAGTQGGGSSSSTTAGTAAGSDSSGGSASGSGTSGASASGSATGSDSGGSASAGGDDGGDDGGCSVGGGPTGPAGALLLALAWISRRRRGA